MQEKVSHLYNTLFNFERKVKKLGAYPIHKRLALPSGQDIYDVILEKGNFTRSEIILDAGCGVGFGSLKVASESNAQVLGISISSKEIEQATKNAQQAENIRCSFTLMPFTMVEPNAFDAIICVESLKHAIPIEQSVKVLLDALKPNGRLFVVDDFYVGSMLKPRTEKAFMADWCLDSLLSLADLPKGSVTDLTEFMPQKSVFGSRMQLFFMTLTRPFVDKVFANVFRGGVYLDMLYSKGKMKYMLYEFTKTKA
ncbi:MAG: class I SAM-dependent methyltransferase [Luteibaculaceae bacterium]